MADKINIVGSNVQGTVAIGSSATARSAGAQVFAGSAATGSLDELLLTLAAHGVLRKDLDALTDAIASDAATQEVASKKLGPTVKAWMNTMFSKAANASWQIEVGVAVGLLTSAIQRYYGWP